MNNRIIIAILCLFSGFVTAQIDERFDDGEFMTNPNWFGDDNNFVVNEALQLQLMASEAGTSAIGLNTNFSDSVVWNLYFNMDFAPSNTNKLVIVLWQNQLTGDSFSLEVGETGSDDALALYAMVGGIRTAVASGTLGAFGSDPAEAWIRVSKASDDLWTLSVAYEEGQVLSEDFSVIWPTQDLSGEHYFGFQCSYSTSRVDKFYFDDIIIDDLLPDTTGPLLVDYSLIDNQSILLCFDEAIDPDSAINASHYEINSGIFPVEISIDISSPSKVLLTYPPLSSSIDYRLTIINIADPIGNTSNGQVVDFNVTEKPTIGDLLINEILFDPYVGGDDFVEIYNKSDKVLDLKSIIIANSQKEEAEQIDDNLILKPNTYVVFTEDIVSLAQYYVLEDRDAVQIQDLPSFNNDSGNVSLRILQDGHMITLDSLDYEDDMHYILLDDTEGVSLERISFDTTTGLRDNWQSASSLAGYATPGYKNSSFISLDAFQENFDIAESTFSPNGDGDNDVLIISYQLDKPSYLANARVYDAQGRIVRELLNNTLLSTEGFVKWDGVDNEGNLASIGIYIIWIEIFDTSGKVSQFKKTAVLADFLN